MTRLRALGALLVVLVVLGVGGAASTVAFNQLNGPEQAVLDYAALIADGRASAAARRVDPETARSGVVVPALVSDTALARATTRLRPLSAAVEDGAADGDDVPVGQVVTVDLTYGLGQQSGVAPLRVRRDQDGFPFTHKWTVLDPLLVPVVVQSNLTTLSAPTLAGVDLPVTAVNAGGGAPAARPVLLYPGIYPLITPSYPLLQATVNGRAPSLVAVHPADASVRRLVVPSTLTWAASPALQAQIATRVVTSLTRCVTDGPSMSAEGCPAGLYALRDRPGLTIGVTPSGLVAGAVAAGVGDQVDIAFTYASPAGVRWAGGAGASQSFPVSGTVSFAPTDSDAAVFLSPS